MYAWGITVHILTPETRCIVERIWNIYSTWIQLCATIALNNIEQVDDDYIAMLHAEANQ
jgi:hypothetical protein